jgi:hypothetical protein
MFLADKWDLPYQTLVGELADQQALLERRDRQLKRGGPEVTAPVQTGVAVPVPRQPEPTSPYAGIRAEQGMIYQQGQNWPLIEARIRSGLSGQEIGRLLHPPMSGADFRRVEEGKFLPSADQIAQLCNLLELRVEDTFVMAGPEPAPPGTRATPIKGFSVVGVLRARRRLSAKALIEAVQAETGVTVGTVFLSRLERGDWKPKAGEPDPVEQAWLEALARYFQIPVEWVPQQIPPALVQRAAESTRQLHQALQAASGRLPALNVDRPDLLLTEGDTNE